MKRDRARRALEKLREELRQVCVANNRSAASHWSLQIHVKRECLKHYLEPQPPEIHPRR